MSGGFGGLFVAEPLGLSLDVATLADPDRSELLDLIARSGLAEAPTGHADDPMLRDGVTYHLTVSTSEATDEYSWMETTIPPEVRPLLEWLRRRAIANRTNPPPAHPTP